MPCLVTHLTPQVSNHRRHPNTLKDSAGHVFFVLFFSFSFLRFSPRPKKLAHKLQVVGWGARVAPARSGTVFPLTLKKNKKKHCTNLQIKESADAPWGVISSPLGNEVYTALMHVLLHIHRPGTKFMLCYIIIIIKKKIKLQIPPPEKKKMSYHTRKTPLRDIWQERKKEKSPLIFFHFYF